MSIREHDEYRDLERRAAELDRTAHRTDWFVTATGKTAFVMSPDESDIDIVDIAAALSRLCRFGGHLKPEVPFYSVAQHSVLVSYAVPEELAFRGLLHDASEAYLGDVIRPLKSVIAPLYKGLEDAWQLAIGRHFGLGPALVHEHPLIKRADLAVLAAEKRDLVSAGQHAWQRLPTPHPDRIVPLSPFDARELFMARFADLSDRARHDPRAWVT